MFKIASHVVQSADTTTPLVPNKRSKNWQKARKVLSKESELYNQMRDVSSRDGLANLLKKDGARLEMRAKKQMGRQSNLNAHHQRQPTTTAAARNKKTQFKVVMQSLSSALVCTLLEYFLHFSFAAAIFSTPQMHGFVYFGFTSNLIGYVIGNLVYACFGSYRFGILSTPSFDVPVMAGAMASIAQNVTDENQLWPTAFVVIVGVSIVLGITFLTLGKLNLLAWTNFIPDPVVYGFLGGNGVALMKSAFVVSTGKSWNLLSPEEYAKMFDLHSVGLFAPALIFGILLSIGNMPSIKAIHSKAHSPQIVLVLLVVLFLCFHCCHCSRSCSFYSFLLLQRHLHWTIDSLMH